MSENGQEIKQIDLPMSITVRELAKTLDASPIEIIKTLMANGMMANINQEDLGAMKELLASGKVKPVIDKRYSLNKTADALRYLGKGHAQGKVVIIVEHPGKT